MSYLSRLLPLEVRDIVSTGTPAGVGPTREPPVFVADGDLVDVEIERLGLLRDPVAAGAQRGDLPEAGARAAA